MKLRMWTNKYNSYILVQRVSNKQCVDLYNGGFNKIDWFCIDFVEKQDFWFEIKKKPKINLKTWKITIPQ